MMTMKREGDADDKHHQKLETEEWIKTKTRLDENRQACKQANTHIQIKEKL